MGETDRLDQPLPNAPAVNSPLLQIDDLQVVFDTGAGPVVAVDHTSFTVSAGETLAIVGESGSGKSATMLAVMGLIQDPGRIAGGRIQLQGRDLADMSRAELRRVRGGSMAMVFQDPMTSLNPLLTIGRQLAESLAAHGRYNRREIKARSLEILERVGLTGGESQLKKYPHQLSGGMRQRVMIAIALICKPELLIADEPTTALDVTVQAQIVELVKELQAEMGTAVVWISHDLGLVAGLADRVMVMYAGAPVEVATVEGIFTAPAHPYTAALLDSLPRLDSERKRSLQAIAGSPPNLAIAAQGCRFQPRCRCDLPLCQSDGPVLQAVAGTDSRSACWRSEDLVRAGIDELDRGAL